MPQSPLVTLPECSVDTSTVTCPRLSSLSVTPASTCSSVDPDLGELAIKPVSPLSDLGAGSHNLAGEVHETNVKKTGRNEGLPRGCFGVSEEDRDKSHVAEPGTPLGGRTSFCFPDVHRVPCVSGSVLGTRGHRGL